MGSVCPILKQNVAIKSYNQNILVFSITTYPKLLCIGESKWVQNGQNSVKLIFSSLI